MPVPRRRRRRTPRRPHTCHARLDSRVTSYSRHATVSAVEGGQHVTHPRATAYRFVRSCFVSSTKHGSAGSDTAFAALVLYFFLPLFDTLRDRRCAPIPFRGAWTKLI